MHTRSLTLALICSAGCLLAPGCGNDQSRSADADSPGMTQPASSFVGTAQPLADWDNLPNAARAGDVTFSGQPPETALDRFAAAGGALVVDNRTHEGGDSAEYDERAAVERLGMTYLHIPMTGDSLTREDVDRFAQAMESVDGPVLLHCRSANRSGGLWAAYLALYKGWDTEAAIAAGKTAGMRSESVEASARRVIGG